MIVGTAGHIDHGKTALVKALTGVDADRLAEEEGRDITIDLGFAYTQFTSDRTTDFVDVPGHERFVHTMLAGASGIDLALLVVAVEDGVMPQTREHVAILDLLGIHRCIVALTKADLADDARRSVVEQDVRTLLSTTSVVPDAVVPVSIITGEGIDALRALLRVAEAEMPTRARDGRFRLAVDRCNTLLGTGVIVTGMILSGSVAAGSRVKVSPSGFSARVRSLQSQNRSAASGHAGQRCALNLACEGVQIAAIARGDMLLEPSLHAPTMRIDADVRLFETEDEAVGEWFPARLHHASAEVGVRVLQLGNAVALGKQGPAQLVLDRPLAAAVGDRFVLRDVSAQRTIGGGRILDLRPPQSKRRTPERFAQLDALRHDDPARALTALSSVAPFVVDLTAFGRDRALSETQMADIAATSDLITLPTGDTQSALSRPQWQRFAESVNGVLLGFHGENSDAQGISREKLRLACEPRLPSPAFLVALQMLGREGRIVLDGAFVRLPGHTVHLSEADEDLWHGIAPRLDSETRFRPPRVRDLAGELVVSETEIRRVLKSCARLGRVDEIAHDHFFLRATTAEMAGLVRACSSQSDGGGFTAANFRDRMDNGRKVAIQILDFFDRHGVTLRNGDLRCLNPHCADLFGALAGDGRETFPVGRPDFELGRGSESVSGGFDSHSLPPTPRRA